MKLDHLISHVKAPCDRCPYKQGLVQTLTDPCPQCKANGYKTYVEFLNKHDVQGKK
jgi:hypothetical protein